MDAFVLSIANNKFKLTLDSKFGYGGLTKELSSDIVQGAHIVDIAGLATQLSAAVSEFKSMSSHTIKAPFYFLVEPEDVILKFITVPKKVENVNETVLAKVSADLVDATIQDLYFSYHKIAPFVFQFVAVRKNFLDAYLQLASTANIDLKGIIPWVGLLPKLSKNFKPSIFVANIDGKQIISLSELGSVYFTQTFDKPKSVDDLQLLVQDLSIYKREKPISSIYVLGNEAFSLASGIDTTQLDLTVEGINSADYVLNILFKKVTETNPAFLQSHFNLLNLLPLPVKSPVNLPVYAGATVSVLLVLGLIGYFTFANQTVNPEKDLADAATTNSAVLSEETTAENKPVTPKKALERKDLKFYVENGAGIEGVAGETKDKLETLGYIVVDIGNADETGQEKSTLKFKSSKKDYKDIVLADLSSSFNLVVEDGLDEASPYDVLLTVGIN